MCQASFICIPDPFLLLLPPHEAPNIKPGSESELNKTMFCFTDIIPRVFRYLIKILNSFFKSLN